MLERCFVLNLGFDSTCLLSSTGLSNQFHLIVGGGAR